MFSQPTPRWFDRLLCDGSRRFSEDLAPGGLEIPCLLTFEGNDKHTVKAQKLVESALATTTTDLLASKKRKRSNGPADPPNTSEDSTPELTKTWVTAWGHCTNYIALPKGRFWMVINAMTVTSTWHRTAEMAIFRNSRPEFNSATGEEAAEGKLQAKDPDCTLERRSLDCGINHTCCT